MTDLILTGNSTALTMSSREIADLTGSRHDNVKRSAERLASDQILTSPLEGLDFEHKGNHYREYRFNKRDSLVLVARLSPEFTAAVVDRWQELENQKAALPDFSNPAIAARAWADEVEHKQAALAQLESARPAVEFVDRYVSAESGSMGFRKVCKLLNARQPEFRQFLKDKRIMYPLGREWTPYQQHIDAGRFVVKAGVAKNEHAFNSALFTAKGVNWIAGLWAAYIEKKAA
jgi:phage antirepressor YoqD-like protein